MKTQAEMLSDVANASRDFLKGVNWKAFDDDAVFRITNAVIVEMNKICNAKETE